MAETPATNTAASTNILQEFIGTTVTVYKTSIARGGNEWVKGTLKAMDSVGVLISPVEVSGRQVLARNKYINALNLSIFI